MPPSFVYEPGPRPPAAWTPERVVLESPRPLKLEASFGLRFALVLLCAACGLAAGGVLLWKGIVWAGVPVLLFFVGFPIIHFVFWVARQGREREAAREAHRKAWLAEVEAVAARLETVARDQRRVRQMEDPDFAASLNRVTRVESTLWSRHSLDEDFLCLRLGLGGEPVRADLMLPEAPAEGDLAALIHDARRQLEPYRQVNGVPVRVSLKEAGVFGVAGTRSEAMRGMANLVVQVATHHSPADVKIAAVYSAPEDGDWLRWLPHTWSDDRQERYLAGDAAAAAELLRTIREDVAAGSPRWWVLLLLDRTLVEDGWMPGSGLRKGLSVVLVETHERALPRETGAMLLVKGGDSQLVRREGVSGEPLPLVPDLVTPVDAERFSRAMAPMRATRASASPIPEEAGLLETLQVSRVSDLSVPEYWRQPAPLELPLGLGAASEPLIVDLSAGPHLLVAGAAASGRRELLRSVLLGLAVLHPPERVSFACLDPTPRPFYEELATLPHLLSSESDLALPAAVDWRRRRSAPPKYSMRRAMVGLLAELTRRQEEAGPDGGSDGFSQLLVVCDDTGWLRREIPGFDDLLVNLARNGPRVGIHLVLASDSADHDFGQPLLEAAALRVAFQVASPQEAARFLGAAAPAPSLSGRGNLGHHGNLWEFQVADCRRHVPGGGEGRDLLEVALDGRRVRLGSGPEIAGSDSQAAVLLAAVVEAARRGRVAIPNPPWLPVLPDAVAHGDLRREGVGWDNRTWRPNPAWLVAPVGIVDDVEHQTQTILELDLEASRNAAVYGGAGGGCSNYLVTTLVALAHEHSPADFHAYLVDFGGGVLSRVQGLPHVGGVVTPDLPHLAERLFRFMQRIAADRKRILANSGYRSVADHRAATTDALPAIAVVIDDYDRFLEREPECAELALALAQEGPALGLHLLVSAEKPSRLGFRMNSLVGSSVALNLQDPSELIGAVGPLGDLQPLGLAGRGVVRATPPAEVQTALPAAGSSEFERNTSLKVLVDAMNAAWKGPRPAPIPVLPDVVTLEDLFHPDQLQWSLDGKVRTAVPVGLDSYTVERFPLDLRDSGVFLLAGATGSGKSTLLRTWLLSLAGHVPPQRLRMAMVDLEAGTLRLLETLPHCSRYVNDAGALGELFRDLEEHRRQWRSRAEGAEGVEVVPWLLVIEDLGAFLRQAPVMERSRLQELVRASSQGGLWVVVTGNASDFASNAFDPLVKALLQARTGVLVGTNDPQGIFGPQLGAEPGTVRPGDAQAIRAGQRVGAFRAATPDRGAISLMEWIEAITWMTAREVEGSPSGGM